jgi:molecular chaperone Hsp33
MKQPNLYIALAYGRQCRVVIVNSLDTVKEATTRHQTRPTASAALGRTLTAGLLLASSLKGHDKYTIRLSGTGPIKEIVVDAHASGVVRGYVSDPYVELMPKANGKLDVSGAIGTTGLLTVVKHIEDGFDFTGQTPFVSGEIAEDFTHYLLTSEQIPSAMALGVLVNPDETIRQAGGYLIQALPGVSDQTLIELETHLKTLPNLTSLLEDTHDLETLAKRITGDDHLQPLETRHTMFQCTCSRQRTEETLRLLGIDELQSMITEQQGADVHCNFCNAHYHFNEQELHAIIVTLQPN